MASPSRYTPRTPPAHESDCSRHWGDFSNGGPSAIALERFDGSRARSVRLAQRAFARSGLIPRVAAGAVSPLLVALGNEIDLNATKTTATAIHSHVIAGRFSGPANGLPLSRGQVRRRVQTYGVPERDERPIPRSVSFGVTSGTRRLSSSRSAQT